MSDNSQYLIKKYKGKYYVFNVMAESWGKINNVYLSEALGEFKRKKDAVYFAFKKDNSLDGSSEYGVMGEVLAKDGAKVFVIDDRKKEDFYEKYKEVFDSIFLARRAIEKSFKIKTPDKIWNGFLKKIVKLVRLKVKTKKK